MITLVHGAEVYLRKNMQHRVYYSLMILELLQIEFETLKNPCGPVQWYSSGQFLL